MDIDVGLEQYGEFNYRSGPELDHLLGHCELTRDEKKELMEEALPQALNNLFKLLHELIAFTPVHAATMLWHLADALEGDMDELVEDVVNSDLGEMSNQN